MEKEKKIIIGILVLAVFVFIVALISLYVQTKISSGDVCGCFIPLPVFIPFVGSIGLFIGTVLYYFLIPTSNMDEKAFLFGFDEKETYIVSELLDKGEVTQSKMVREGNMNKVQIFRTLKGLQKKGIVEKRPYGKTNMIGFTDKVKKIIRK